MKSFSSSLAARALPGVFKASISMAALFAAALSAHAQVVYNTNFSGYTNNSELTSGQTTAGGTGQQGWTTNDPDNNTAGTDPTNPGYVSINTTGSAPGYEGGYIGGLNYVGTAASGSGFTDGPGAFIGGDYRELFDSTSPASPGLAGNNDVLPGAATTYLYHAFALPVTTTSYTYTVDSTILGFGAGPTTPANAYDTAKDTFGYAFRNSAGTTLFSINFSPSQTNSQADIISYTTGGPLGTTVNSTVPGKNGVSINGRYHFIISVNSVAQTFDVLDYGQGQTVAQAVDLFGGPVSLSNAIVGTQVLPNSVTQVAALWTLSNQTSSLAGGPTSPAYYYAGYNSLVFDNYNVSAVPEPSTYAMMGVGFLGLLGVMKFPPPRVRNRLFSEASVSCKGRGFHGLAPFALAGGAAHRRAAWGPPRRLLRERNRESAGPALLPRCRADHG